MTARTLDDYHDDEHLQSRDPNDAEGRGESLRGVSRRLLTRISAHEAGERPDPEDVFAGRSAQPLAEALGRYSNLGETGVSVRSVRNRVAKDVRGEPWKVPEPTGANRTRLILAGHEASVRADYGAGVGSVSLARKYGVPVNTLLDWLRREGIEIRSGEKLSTDDMIEVRHLLSDGWSHQRIADRFGVSRSAVSLRLARERRRDAGATFQP